MKILGWMHRKLRSSEPLRDFAIGNPCLSGQPLLDDLQYYPKSNYGPKPLGKSLRENYLRKSFAGLESAKIEEDEFEEDSTAANSELFHGFLTIGTLGSDPTIADPSTPTFTISVENITENETEVTENDLKLINDELEKVLGIEGKDDGCNESSGRNSHVSTGRSSHGSTITLSGNGTSICPLQGYLFGSAIELPETTVMRKENRTSLGELFQRTKMDDENHVSKSERGDKRGDKESDKSAIHIMKNMLKKRMVHASSRATTSMNGRNVDSASTETKLHKDRFNLSGSIKIFHKFQRKVYPEGSMAARKSDNLPKNETKNNIKYERRYGSGDDMLPEEDIMIFPQISLSKETKPHLKGHASLPQATVNGSDSNGNRECWIKTDADYLVLEL